MLEISGIRLDHYNDGNIVPMYGTTDRGTSAAVDAPVCGVRDVDGIAKSECDVLHGLRSRSVCRCRRERFAG